MILSALKVLELNEKYNLIEGLSERELENPEGTILDLRVGQIHNIIGESLLGVKERYSSKTEIIGDVNKDGNKRFTIRPGEYYLVTTMEIIHSPPEKVKYDESLPEGYIIPKIFPRTSLQRGGISLHCSNTNPGYKGQLTFGIKNLGNQDFIFELGARMFSIEYVGVIGDIKRAYSGQHQGGRVTSGGKVEVQN
jgi:deoxycytidine triphosphate deaminase